MYESVVCKTRLYTLYGWQPVNFNDWFNLAQ